MRPALTHPTRIFTAVALAVAALAGCGGDETVDRAGNPETAKTMELVLANWDTGEGPVAEWVDTVERLSGGSIAIQVESGYRHDEVDYDAGIIEDVRSGEVDLAFVGARAFDEVGVTTFQPLVAPLLVDSLELQEQVLRDDVGRDALAGVDELGLVGLALLPGELRRPVGLDAPLVDVQDFDGKLLYARAGTVGRKTLAALGARAERLPGDDWAEGVDGAEVGLSGLRSKPEVLHEGAKVTANAVLWPVPSAVVMNQEAFDGLDEQQRSVLRRAWDEVFEAQSRLTADLVAEDAVTICRIGVELRTASPAQLAGIREAVEPVYDLIERAPGNAAALERIRELKAGAEPEPLECADDGSRNAGSEPAAKELEGTFRARLTEDELAQSPLLIDANEVNDENWGALQLRFTGDEVRYSQRNDRAEFSVEGDYTTEGDVLSLSFDDIGETWKFRWSLYRGTLKLERDDGLLEDGAFHAPTPLVIVGWKRQG